MSILDNNQKEVIHIERPYRCVAWCCFCCLQHMEVQSPPGTVIGYIDQVNNTCIITTCAYACTCTAYLDYYIHLYN